MQYPPFVDEDLAVQAGDLPQLLEQFGGRLTWHRVATVAHNGTTHFMCLAFSARGEVVTLGMLSEDGTQVVPLSEIGGDIVLISRERPDRHCSKAGISLVLLMQAVRYMETYLLRNMHGKQAEHRFLDSAFVQIGKSIFGASGPPVIVPADDVLSLAAATKVAEMFFSARVYGGEDQLDELMSAYGVICESLGDALGDAGSALLRDLERLKSRAGQKWGGKELELQEHVTAYILALLRVVEAQQATCEVAAV